MTFIRKAVCLVLMGLIVLGAGNVAAIQLAKPAPDFTLNDLNGSKVRLSDFKGKVVVLNFWSSTCAPCVAEMPSLNALQRDLKGSGLVVLGVALDRTVKPVKDLADRLRISYSLLMDSQQDVYFDTYALFGQPVSIIIDRSGIIHDKLIGEVDWSSPQIRSKINMLLKGR